MNKSKNLAIPVILIAVVGFIFFTSNNSKVMKCSFFPNAQFSKDPEFFELKRDKVVACGLNNISPINKVTLQGVTAREIQYTCSIATYDTHVTVNRYTGDASLFHDDDYSNSFKGTCREVEGKF